MSRLPLVLPPAPLALLRDASHAFAAAVARVLAMRRARAAGRAHTAGRAHVLSATFVRVCAAALVSGFALAASSGPVAGSSPAYAATVAEGGAVASAAEPSEGGSETDGESQAAIQTDITELCLVAEELDGKLVEFSGEAIGEPVRAAESGYVWVNLADSEQTIGVYMTREAADGISGWGDFDTIGSTVHVVGTYWVSSAQGSDGGVLCVHASEVSVLDDGVNVEHGFGDMRVLAASGILLAAGLVLFVAYRWRRR